MWRNYVVLEIPHRAVEPFLLVFRAVSIVRFDSAFRSQRVARNRVLYTYDRQFSMLAQRKSFRKRDEVAFTPCPTHFSASSLRFSKMSYQSVSDFIFRFTFAIRRCTTPEALVASVGWHSHNTGRFALLSERITHFACIYHESLLPFTPFFITF